MDMIPGAGNDSSVEARFLLVKRGLYYGPDNCGYTGIKEHAGRYFETDARPDCGVTAVHEDEAADYSAACFDDLARDHLRKKISEKDAEIARLKQELAQRPQWAGGQSPVTCGASGSAGGFRAVKPTSAAHAVVLGDLARRIHDE